MTFYFTNKLEFLEIDTILIQKVSSCVCNESCSPMEGSVNEAREHPTDHCTNHYVTSPSYPSLQNSS